MAKGKKGTAVDVDEVWGLVDLEPSVKLSASLAQGYVEMLEEISALGPPSLRGDKGNLSRGLRYCIVRAYRQLQAQGRLGGAKK